MCLNNCIKGSISHQTAKSGSVEGNMENLLNECNYVDLSELETLDIRRGDLNILQWNSRSLLGNFTNLKNILQLLEESGIFVDIIMICESHLNSIKEKLVDLNGYRLFNMNRQLNKCGGVCIYVRNSYTVKLRDDLNNFIEGMLESLILELTIGKKKHLICEIYRPPGGNIKSFLEHYEQLITKLRKDTGELIIGGDFNVDLLKTDSCSYSASFLELNTENLLLPTISKPSRVTKNSATLIDNIFVSSKLSHAYSSNILLDDSSDHLICLTSLHRDIKKTKESYYITRRDLSDKNLLEIKATLGTIDWNPIVTDTDTDSSFEKFHKKLEDTLDKISPYKSTRVSGKSRIRDPWITPGLVKSSKQLSKLFGTLQRNPTKREEYIVKRNLLNKLRRISRIKFFNDKFSEFSGNSRKVWNLINCVLNKMTNKSDFIELIKVRDKEYNSPKDIATVFADHFLNVGKTSASTKNIYRGKLKDKIPNNPKSVYLQPITTFDLCSIISTLKAKRSSGYDDFSNNMLKEISNEISVPMAHIINLSITTGTFPKKMKLAEVTPLHKGKERFIVTNYRPISLLITLSKLLEKAVHTQLNSFLEKTNMYFDGQFGFRKGYSTVNAVEYLCSEILKEHEDKRLVGAVYVDLSKAFDTIDHKTLLRKLDKMGIRGVANKWVNSYLNGRFMRVKIKSKTGVCLSENLEIKRGCPQGSILGPFYFCCMINDLHLYLTECKAICYADDTTVYCSGKNISEIQHKLEEDFVTLVQWFAENNLSLNVFKTQFQIFNLGKTSTPSAAISIDGNTINSSESVKMLGFFIDDKLKWTKHVDMIMNKLNSSKFMLDSCKNVLSYEAKLMYYHAHFSSHLSYGLRLWGPMCNKTQLGKLFKKQKKVIRSICNSSYRAHTDPLYKSTGILKLNEMICLDLLKLSYKLQHEELPVLLNECFQSEKESTTRIVTRNSKLPKIRRHTSSIYNKSFLNKVIILWTKIPMSCKCKLSLSSFVKETKKFIKNTPQLVDSL